MNKIYTIEFDESFNNALINKNRKNEKSVEILKPEDVSFFSIENILNYITKPGSKELYAIPYIEKIRKLCMKALEWHKENPNTKRLLEVSCIKQPRKPSLEDHEKMEKEALKVFPKLSEALDKMLPR